MSDSQNYVRRATGILQCCRPVVARERKGLRMGGCVTQETGNRTIERVAAGITSHRSEKRR